MLTAEFFYRMQPTMFVEKF